MNEDLVCSSPRAAPSPPARRPINAYAVRDGDPESWNPSGWPQWERTVVPDPVVGWDARARDGGRLVPERKCSRLRSQRPDRLSTERRGRQSSRPPVPRAGVGVRRGLSQGPRRFLRATAEQRGRRLGRCAHRRLGLQNHWTSRHTRSRSACNHAIYRQRSTRRRVRLLPWALAGRLQRLLRHHGRRDLLRSL